MVASSEEEIASEAVSKDVRLRASDPGLGKSSPTICERLIFSSDGVLAGRLVARFLDFIGVMCVEEVASVPSVDVDVLPLALSIHH